MKTLIIIPAYKEVLRLVTFLNELRSFNTNKELGTVLFRVVDDGSGYQEAKITKEIVLATKVNEGTQIQFEKSSPNKGKGAVLRTSFLKPERSDFDLIGFLDADGSTSFSELAILIKHLIDNKSVDVVIGSRLKCLGKTVERSLKRHLSGRIFATLVSNLFDIPIYDSQCGAKVFKTKVLSNKTLDFCDDNRWLFDTQLIIFLYKKGYKIHELPVSWINKDGSRVNLIKDSLRMFYGLIKYKKKLKTIDF